ncbi:hypothetical protein BHM03_00005618 [Ensete ventricosum]|uniref:Uncharacterized protein n=1 Tax=Ensete ventricosum TaxID=4639 RepID=A0A445MBA0_ENSVE|nr:hypothetical protein BHM03_00005618 [Ensete ventricosum]
MLVALQLLKFMIRVRGARNTSLIMSSLDDLEWMVGRRSRCLHAAFVPVDRRRAPTLYQPEYNQPPLSNCSSVPTGSPVRPERQLISLDLAAVAEPAEEELGSWGDVYAAATNVSLGASNGSPLFERGRFYQLYSARRNERLKRKKGEIWGGEAVAEDPGVAVELAKRRVSKKAEGVRKSMPPDFSGSRASSLRSSLRCSKEMKNKNAYVVVAEGSAVGGRRTSTRSVRRL